MKEQNETADECHHRLAREAARKINEAVEWDGWSTSTQTCTGCSKKNIEAKEWDGWSTSTQTCTGCWATKTLGGNSCSAKTYNSSFNESDKVSDNIVHEHNCGHMTSPRVYCSPKHFTSESTGKGDGFTLCCSKRDVQLPPLFAVPAWLQQLYQGKDGKYHNFRDNTQSCNSALLQTHPFQISGIYKQTVFHRCMDMYLHLMNSHVMWSK